MAVDAITSGVQQGLGLVNRPTWTLLLAAVEPHACGVRVMLFLQQIEGWLFWDMSGWRGRRD